MDLNLRITQNEGEFTIIIDLMNKQKENVIKQYAKYDSGKKLYKMPMNLYQKLKKSNLKFTPLPNYIEKCTALPKSLTISEMEDIKAENKLLKADKISTLRNYQWLGCKCIKISKKMMLSDDMGLGKTIQTFACIGAVDAYPVMIATPSTLVENWENELLKWTNIGGHNIVKIRKGKDIIPVLHNIKIGMKKIILVTVDLAAKNAKEFEKKFAFGVLDEAHSVKNEMTIRYKGLSKILNHCEYSILISGTPITGKIEELFTQLKICRPDFFKNKMAFGSRYSNVRQFMVNGITIQKFDGTKNIDELNFLMQNMMIRRKKQDILQLADKNRTCVVRQINEKDLKWCTSLFDRLKKSSKKQNDDDVLREAMGSKNSDISSLWLDLYRATCQAKIQFVKDYIQELLECKYNINEKPVEGVTSNVNGILFFCHHQMVI
eukprot:NODE_563_length_5987_cov_2.002717.p2 type:complete len:434 gc:universal NODE_563_length_5987_cov_2.002717:2713-1412(-)